MRIALVAPAVLLLAGCMTGMGTETSQYSQERAELEADCRARQGILTPIPRSTGMNAATDYQCEIRGGPSDRLQPDVDDDD